LRSSLATGCFSCNNKPNYGCPWTTTDLCHSSRSSSAGDARRRPSPCSCLYWSAGDHLRLQPLTDFFLNIYFFAHTSRHSMRLGSHFTENRRILFVLSFLHEIYFTKLCVHISRRKCQNFVEKFLYFKKIRSPHEWPLCCASYDMVLKLERERYWVDRRGQYKYTQILTTKSRGYSNSLIGLDHLATTDSIHQT
jgi:hypothetical protein